MALPSPSIRSIRSRMKEETTSPQQVRWPQSPHDSQATATSPAGELSISPGFLTKRPFHPPYSYSALIRPPSTAFYGNEMTSCSSYGFLVPVRPPMKPNMMRTVPGGVN